MPQTLTATQPPKEDTPKKRYTLREVQNIAQPYGLLIQSLNSNSRAPYGIYFDNQLVAQANKLTEVIATLPELYRAISEQLAHNTAQPTTPQTQPAEIQVLEKHNNEYITYNPQNGNYYVVRPNHPEPRERCECADTYYRSGKCKHQRSVEKHLSVSLLDKPFDELTLVEWQDLKISDQDQVEETLEETEIDSIPDPDFGILCRLWHSSKLLGTFYRKIFTDTWVATPTDSIHPYYCPSEDDARYWLVAHMYKASA